MKVIEKRITRGWYQSDWEITEFDSLTALRRVIKQRLIPGGFGPFGEFYRAAYDKGTHYRVVDRDPLLVAVYRCNKAVDRGDAKM